MARLQRMIEEDHQFNDAPAQNDGWHKIVHWVQESGQLNPLNPGATAPSNVGGPPITWEQEDVYGVPRAWLREANGFLVHSMIGYTEIRVDSFNVTPVPQSLVTPPDDSYGEIICIQSVDNRVSRGFYQKTGGVVRDMSYQMAFNGVGAPSIGIVGFGAPLLPLSGDIQVSSTSGGNITCDFRILYRYL